MNLALITTFTNLALKTVQEPWIGTVPSLINEALNQIQQRRSWSCMKVEFDFTLNVAGPGPFVQALPATFKEPQGGPNGLRASDGTPYGNSIWRLYSKQEVFKLTQIGTNVADRVAYLDQDSTGIWSLYFPGPLDQLFLPTDTAFAFDTYQYLAPVAAATDENDLMKRYPMLILEYCKMLVFSLGSDEDSMAMKRESQLRIDGDGSPNYPGLFRQASADDTSHQNRGRTWRMGGY